ncbi:MAG: AMP-binding protein [Pseudomonadota bacterium]
MTTDALHHQPLMPHLLIEGLNRYNDEPCLYLGDKVASYKDVRETTSQMVQALQSKGLGVGSRIAVISANRPEVLSNIAAMQLTGCIGTPLHPLGSLDDHAYVLEAAEIDTLVFDASVFSDVAAALKERVSGLRNLLGFGPNDVGDDYIALAAQFEPRPLQAPAVAPSDIASINFTGGTTGKPKGVMSTYSVTSCMTQIQMCEWEFPAELRMLIATPLSHAAAAFFIPVLQKGGAFYVMQGFSPDEFFDTVKEHQITCTMLVPVMLYFLLDSPRATDGSMDSMETIFYGASPMSPARLQEGLQKWGQIFYQFFGQSECPMVIANMRKKEHDPAKPERFASCGRPTPWIHMALLDGDGNEVPRGEPGEICVRGPLVMKGYKDMPEQTAEAFAGGWLHTGDVGKLDEDGFLYIVDRTKDMIVSGGFNVFPREVEDVLATHEAVAQVVVIGVPDEQWGEAVKAVVVLKPDVNAGDDLVTSMQSLVKEAKGSVQSPKSIDFVDAIPLTPVGKPDKKAVRAQYWEGNERGVG